MNRREQRNLITRYGKSQLRGAALAVLKELVNCNWLGKNNRDADAEAKPFKVSIAKLAARAGTDPRTVARCLTTLEYKELVTIVKGKVGTADEYLLHLGVMETWAAADEIAKLKAQQRVEKKTAWARAKRAGKHEAKDGSLMVQLRPRHEFFQFVLHPNHFLHDAQGTIVRSVAKRI